MPGALHGVRVIEIGGLGPAPFAAMMLADHGADVLRVERPSKALGSAPSGIGDSREGLSDFDTLNRGRGCVTIDLQHERGLNLLLDLSRTADVLIEGFRPGVTERLGFGPEVVAAINPRLVYGRMTGWGQTGPLAQRAGHDINYISLAGAQAHIGRAGAPPTPPLNLVGDFGGGGMLLAFGICAALLSRASSGLGQVVDAAMIDGSALLMAPLFGASQTGFWNAERGTNFLDSGAPFYDCYECSDGAWISVGALEPKFFAALCEELGLDGSWAERQYDRECWPELRQLLTDSFSSATRDHWAQRFESVDACVSPVLTMAEVGSHGHNRARQVMTQVGQSMQPSPAPRFSNTPAEAPTAAEMPGAHTRAHLLEWGIEPSRIDALTADGVVV